VASILGWTAIAGAGLLTLWALWAFRATRLHLTPLVREGGSLIVTGPYRWVRHPMYSAVLLLSAGLVLLDPAWIRIGAAALMVPALAGKMAVEEKLLKQAYPEYDKHAQRTKRCIPGVW
jgi:protein-S-isoprenylcysteine O-methyltransferase Ste14